MAEGLSNCNSAVARPLPAGAAADTRPSLELTRKTMPKNRTELFAFLAGLLIETRAVEHPPLFTVEQSQALRGEIAGGHTKNLFLKDKKDQVFLVVAGEDADIDMKSLHKRIGSARLSFGRPELLLDLLGVIPGSVTPFGVVNDERGVVTVILDETLMRHELLNFHPLENTATTTIGREDFVTFLEAAGHRPRILAVSSAGTGEGLENRADFAT
jgi:Ala-tRNA(Pro) deacylase